MVSEKEKEKIIEYWSREYKKVDSKPRYCNIATINLFNRFFPDLKNKKVLDIGCGHDMVMNYFKNKKAKIVGVDICPEVVKKMQEEGFEIIEADCCSLPFEDNTFDIVFSIGVVEHFKDTEKAVREHIRVAKKRGKVVIIIPNLIGPFFFICILYYLLNGDLLKYGKTASDGKYFTKKKLKNMMKGCKDIKILCYSSSALLRMCAKKYNKKLAESIENSWLNKKVGLLLFAIGTKE